MNTMSAKFACQFTGGELVTIRVREKGRLTEEGVEGIVFALLHPKTLIEVGEYWVPLSAMPQSCRARSKL